MIHGITKEDVKDKPKFNDLWESINVYFKGAPVIAHNMSALKQHRVDQTKKKLLLGNSYMDQDLIFCQDDGKATHPDTISSWFQKFLADNELPRIRFHDLRHTHITMLLERGVSNIAVAERAGHADPSTPGRIYGQVTVSMRDDAANKIEEAMSRK